MTTYDEFYARVRERLAAARVLLDHGARLLRQGDYTLAGELFEAAKAEHDAMLAEMQAANAEHAP